MLASIPTVTNMLRKLDSPNIKKSSIQPKNNIYIKKNKSITQAVSIIMFLSLKLNDLHDIIPTLKNVAHQYYNRFHIQIAQILQLSF